MTDTGAVRDLIESKGLKYSFVAKAIGLTYQGFINKVENVREFKASEIDKLCELLGVSALEEKERIFFAH